DTRAAADTPEGRERRSASAQKAEREGVEGIVDEMLQLLLSKTAIDTRPDVANRVRRIAVQNHPEGLAAAQRGMAARPDSTEMLANLNRPALVLVGSADRLSTPEETRSWQQRMPNSRLAIIHRAGHLSSIEQPKAFNSALADFIATFSC